MSRSSAQFRLTTLLLAVACVAVNAWLFRLGPLWGILGLNVTKHVVIAALCKNLGIDQATTPTSPPITPAVDISTTTAA